MHPPRLHPGLPATALLAVGLGFASVELGPRALLAAIALPCALLLLMHPRWSFWALIASIPVTVDFGSGITVTRVLLPLVIVSVAGNALLRRCAWPNPFGSPAALTGTLFFAAIALSTVTASALHGGFVDAVRVNKELTAYLTRAVLYMLTLSMLRTPGDVRAAVCVLVMAGVAEALVVVAQVHFRLVLPGDWRSAAVNNVEGTSGAFRAEGTTPHPIYLAGYLQMVLPFAVLLGLQARMAGRLVMAGCIALMMYAWSAAVSRSSMLGLVAMVATVMCIASRLGRALVVGAVVVALLALSAHGWSITDLADTMGRLRNFGGGLSAHQLTSTAGSLQFRLESWLGGWGVFLAYPLTGAGLGQAYHLYQPYLPGWAESPFHPQDIHNAFIGVAADVGVLGLAGLLGLWYFALAGVRAAWADAAMGPYARALLVALVGQVIFLFMNPMVRDMWFTAALGAALGQVMRARSDSPAAAPASRQRQPPIPS